MFTAPVTVHRVDHTGRGVPQGPEHGCFAVAEAAAQSLMRKDKTFALNPRPQWYIAERIESTGKCKITYLSKEN